MYVLLIFILVGGAFGIAVYASESPRSTWPYQKPRSSRR